MGNQNKLREEVIEIKGMHCKSCVEKIETKLSQLKGVDKARVSLVEEKVYICFNPTQMNLDTIKKEIESIGYGTGINSKTKKSSIKEGIIYGLIPHIGCIAFIIGSILGVTVLMEFFKPLLMNRYFFHILILISLMFATISSAIYLRKNSFLSLAGIKRKWKYLLTMYGSTIGINLVLFMVIFPLLANVPSQSITGVTGAFIGIGGENDIFSLRLKVDIPCPGHAPLISEELKSINGIAGVQFSFPNIFDVKYDSTKTSKQQILSLGVFKTYKATVIDKSSAQQITNIEPIDNRRSSCGCGGNCGGRGCCGG